MHLLEVTQFDPHTYVVKKGIKRIPYDINYILVKEVVLWKH